MQQHADDGGGYIRWGMSHGIFIAAWSISMHVSQYKKDGYDTGIALD